MRTGLRTAVYEFAQTPNSLVQIRLRAGQADPDGIARHLSESRAWSDAHASFPKQRERELTGGQAAGRDVGHDVEGAGRSGNVQLGFLQQAVDQVAAPPVRADHLSDAVLGTDERGFRGRLRDGRVGR